MAGVKGEVKSDQRVTEENQTTVSLKQSEESVSKGRSDRLCQIPLRNRACNVRVNNITIRLSNIKVNGDLYKTVTGER